tara:strand:- start:551 stop:1207 length:657 start_codon:yes stop_codon:yes gene_type:complete
MKKRLVIAISLLVLLTTIHSQNTFVISKFNVKKIIVENNFLLKDEDIKNLLIPVYNQNLFFLKNIDVKKALLKNSFIESFNIKKKYPNTLKIRIFEKKPIALLFNDKKKFYLSERIDLIEFKNLPNYKDLPYVYGNKDDFKIFYDNLKKINFPLDTIEKYTLYETKRWDLETKNNKIIRLPTKKYIESLKSYLSLKSKNGFEKYEIYDYRIGSQLILK